MVSLGDHARWSRLLSVAHMKRAMVVPARGERRFLGRGRVLPDDAIDDEPFVEERSGVNSELRETKELLQRSSGGDDVACGLSSGRPPRRARRVKALENALQLAKGAPRWISACG
jgi:hypothetical protein